MSIDERCEVGEVRVEPAKTWFISTEALHNWRARSTTDWAGYYGDLPIHVRTAIERAHDAHHNDGKDARETVVALCAKLPCLIFG